MTALKKFMDILNNFKPFYMSILFKDTKDNKNNITITFNKTDITNIVEEYKTIVNNTIPSLKPNKVLVENFKEFVDPKVGMERLDELFKLFDDNIIFYNMLDHYVGVFEGLKACDYINIDFKVLTKTFYLINDRRIIVKVESENECNSLENLNLVFEVYENENC